MPLRHKGTKYKYLCVFVPLWLNSFVMLCYRLGVLCGKILRLLRLERNAVNDGPSQRNFIGVFQFISD